MTIRLLLECPPVVWILRWYKLVINVEEHNTEFQIAANFKHKPCGNTRVILSGDLQCLRLEETIIKTKTKNWDNLIFKTCILHSLESSNKSFFKTKNKLIFKTCILHSFVSRSRVFIESSTWEFQIKSYSIVLLFASLFSIICNFDDRRISPPHLSIHLAPNDGKEASIHGSGAEPHSNLDEDVGDGDGEHVEDEEGDHEEDGKGQGIQSSCKEPGSHSFLHKRQLTKKLIDLSKQMTNWWKVWWSDLWHVVCCLPALLLGVPPLK